MDCPEREGMDSHDYLEHFRAEVLKRNVPLTGTFDLTYRCNFSCTHCYVGGQLRSHDLHLRELDTGRICGLIDECAEAGCLTLVLTGGEPMLRPDFLDIYRHAKLNGLFVTVFTNGSLVTGDVLDVFDDLPPRAVEITLYGASDTTYERITGVRGSFRRCVAGIEALLDRNVNVRLKTVLMTHNRHEFFGIEKIAEDLGVKFRFDACVFSRLDGGDGPLALRVSPEEAVEKGFASDQRAREWVEYFGRSSSRFALDRLYGCGAGVSVFHVTPSGRLQPCMMIPWINYDLATEGLFSDGWRAMVRAIMAKKMPQGHKCSGCEMKNLCGYCPAFFRLETGSETTPSDFLCAIGHYRRDAILRWKKEGDGNDVEIRTEAPAAV